MEDLLRVGTAPHIFTKNNTSTIMLDVVIALLPAFFAGVFFFGYRAAAVTVISVASAVAFEHLWNVLFKRKTTVYDVSAVVSGMLLAFNLPVTVPLWIPVIGSFFMIIIVKMCFGGLGQNFLNPALAARAFLVASWPDIMTKFVNPGTKLVPFMAADAVASPTPLTGEAAASYIDLFLGNVGGCIGETSKIALLIGLAYLMIRRVVSWRIPVTFVGTVAVITWVFGGEGLFNGDWLFQILSGGLLLGAFFMATDYSTTPVTKGGMLVFGVGCGIMTSIFRLIGGSPEGVSYAILLMNVAYPLIEKATIPRRFGKAGIKNA